MKYLQAQIVVAYANNNMNRTATAKAFYCHTNTIEYHLKAIKEQTGIDPKTFHGLVKLYEQAKQILNET